MMITLMDLLFLQEFMDACEEAGSVGSTRHQGEVGSYSHLTLLIAVQKELAKECPKYKYSHLLNNAI